MSPLRLCLPLLISLLLPACDRLGIPDPAKTEATKLEDGKAIGGACRHSGRALEDCYTLNPTASKSAIFAGWREMNDYMAENKIDIVKPEIPVPVPVPPEAKASGPEANTKASTPDAKGSSPEDAAPEAAPGKRRPRKTE